MTCHKRYIQREGSIAFRYIVLLLSQIFFFWFFFLTRALRRTAKETSICRQYVDDIFDKSRYVVATWRRDLFQMCAPWLVFIFWVSYCFQMCVTWLCRICVLWFILEDDVPKMWLLLFPPPYKYKHAHANTHTHTHTHTLTRTYTRARTRTTTV